MDSTEVSQYDATGTTLQSHKKSTYQYDDSGIRVAQTELDDVNNDGDFEDIGTDTSQRTDYLVDHHNPTGYAQVLEEMLDPDGDGNAAATLAKSYTIGHDVFLETVAGNQLRHLLKDGHGSTRQLVDGFGNVIQNGQTPQIFAYDAYGNPHGFTLAQALTTHLYSGEQTDSLTGLQYLRARYYNPATGTFNRLDPFAGNMQDPQSLHKYLYCHGNPVNGVDPTGQFFGAMFLGFLGGLATGFGLNVKYDKGFVLPAGCGALGALLKYMVPTHLGNIRRHYLGGDTKTVKIYITPLTGIHARDPKFTTFRSELLAGEVMIEKRLNALNPGNTVFDIVNGAVPTGTTLGYHGNTKTIHIGSAWENDWNYVAQDNNFNIHFCPNALKEEIQRLKDDDTILRLPTGAERTTYLANLVLHESAHAICDRAPHRQWEGFREHTGDGLMKGIPYGRGNIPFVVGSQEVLDFDESTKAEIRAVLGTDYGGLY